MSLTYFNMLYYTPYDIVLSRFSVLKNILKTIVFGIKKLPGINDPHDYTKKIEIENFINTYQPQCMAALQNFFEPFIRYIPYIKDKDSNNEIKKFIDSVIRMKWDYYNCMLLMQLLQDKYNI